jgi:hypothetical protein
MRLIKGIDTNTTASLIDELVAIPISAPFEEKRISSVSELSMSLLKLSGQSESVVNAKALGFFFRDSNLRKFAIKHKESRRFGRGFAFQIAPTNTPITGFYGALFSYIAGNTTITRISPEAIEQILPILEAFDALPVEVNRLFGDGLCFVSYPKELGGVTELFSKASDVRIIWGGDSTISELKKLDVKPSCVELLFPDKFSVAAIDADKLVETTKEKMEVLARNFAADLFTFDHNACSSPKAIFWLGDREKKKQAKKMFWSSINQLLSVDKFDWHFVFKREERGLKIKIAGQYELLPTSEFINLFATNYPLKLQDLSLFANGNLLEYDISSLSSLKFLNSSKFQTICYFGIDPEEINKIRIFYGLHGFDRIVPIGQTLQMSELWDGIDFYEQLTKKYTIKI